MRQVEEVLLLWELGQRGHLMGTPSSRARKVKELERHLTDPTVKDLAHRLMESLDQETSIGAAFALHASNQERISILESLKQRYLADGGHPFLYHGTTLGRLDGILKQGLTPGQPSNWKQDNLSAHCASHVFLTESPGAAADWATAAHQRGKGPRDARNRRPIVIRIPLYGFQVETDYRSAHPESVMTTEVVPVTGAVGAYACAPEFAWLPLSDMAKQKNLPEYLDPIETIRATLCPA